KREDEKTAPRIGRERMDRRQHAGANEEGAEQRQRERDNREQHRPRLEGTALFGDRERMDQRGAGQPRHERRVLDRIPEPPAAPAEYVVRPPRAERDAEREERPREQGPRARPADPARVALALEQRGDRERERDREPDVAGVEHRRMDDE